MEESNSISELKNSIIENNKFSICKDCDKNNTNMKCFCNKLKYYNENIEYIIKIQMFIKAKIIKKQFIIKKLSKKQKYVDEIFIPDKNGISKWITREELKNTPLKLSNNGNCRHGKFFNDCRFIWEKKIVNRSVASIRTNGYDIFNNENINKRQIKKFIKDYHYKSGCVSCGCKSGLVIDHKNDLYNDPRVLNINTQYISDFQCLCNHCNIQKRQICKYTKDNNKRYGATNIPKLKIFGIDFISGDETFNINDIDSLKGTYWYDPIAFMEYIKNNLLSLSI